MDIYGSTGVWYLIGAILVWFMQAGFAMVETGFTRAKNAGNIIMKNLMDFCLGTIVFVLLGAGLLMGEDALFGLVGIPNLGLFTDFAGYDWSTFFFNLVFCATTATIVSGAMAERTKFLSYCIYSLVISAVVYPIEAHWAWGGGWLSKEILGVTFIDFAGSALIHFVGGISSFIGALILGPRWGKYLDKDGKPTLLRKEVKYVRAIPGHNLTIGALGVFILWFCWYGFNGAAAADITHGCNGLWGTIACGLFSTSTGLFYTGSFAQLGVQLIGIIAIAAWTIFCMVILFNILKHTVGLRASRVEEIEGLDKHEHGLPSAYADFAAVPLAAEMLDPEGVPVPAEGVVVTDASAPAEAPALQASSESSKLSKVVILTKQSKFEDLKSALAAIGVTGITVTQVLGCGVQKGASEYYRGVKVDMDLLPKVKVEVVVSKVPVSEVVATARKALYTGHIGDGKIFVYDVEDVVRVRTGESGYDALQDEPEKD